MFAEFKTPINSILIAKIFSLGLVKSEIFINNYMVSTHMKNIGQFYLKAIVVSESQFHKFPFILLVLKGTALGMGFQWVKNSVPGQDPWPKPM